MATTIRTAKASYTVDTLSLPISGPATIVVRTPSGKKRHLGVADVGRARFEAAVTHYLAERRTSSVPA